ncbi:MAG: hypothetical protein LBC71_02150 [Oscillospiraceae bacterium]|jgi:hypothetical protein|nr:hypothetical protein [Oscillospiraceae bacterium]
MKITKIIDLKNNGVLIKTDEQHLYAGCDGTIYKYQLDEMSLISSLVLFNAKKTNKYSTVYFSIFDEFIFVCEFCSLHIVKKETMQLLCTVRLGENSSSDILGVIDFIYPNAYVNIRNGKIAIFNVNTQEIKWIVVDNSSSWSSCVTSDRIYYSTTYGALLELERNTLRELRRIQLTKKMNIYGVEYHNDVLYTVSEKGFKIVDVNTFKISQEEPNIFSSTEARMPGIFNDTIVVAEWRKIALFHTHTLLLLDRFSFPTGYHYMREALLNGSNLYGSDEHGIYSLEGDLNVR